MHVAEQTGFLATGCGVLLGGKTNQRTSGPVKAHLVPVMYWSTFVYMHVYSPRAGAEHPLGTKFFSHKKSESLIIASFKSRPNLTLP